MFDEESFWIQNSKWPASPLVCLWIIYPLFFFNTEVSKLLAIRRVTQGIGLLEFFYFWLLPCTDTNNYYFTKKVYILILVGRTIISYCVWGLLALMVYLFIVVSFNQEYQYHTSIPVSTYVFVGYFICSDMYAIGRILVIVLWKKCLRQGVVCHCDKNTNLVAHFIGTVHPFDITWIQNYSTLTTNTNWLTYFQTHHYN